MVTKADIEKLCGVMERMYIPQSTKSPKTWSPRASRCRQDRDETTLFVIHAMKRSGHHGFIQWLAHHFRDVVYLNNPDLTQNPWKSFNYYETIVQGVPKMTAARCVFVGPKLEKRFYPSWPDGIEERKKEVLIVSYEDTDLEKAHLAGAEVSEYVGEFDKIVRILVLRDPFNMMASRIRCAQKVTHFQEPDCKPVELWKQHAREFLGITNYLRKQGTHDGCKSVSCKKINYLAWHSSPEYRGKLAKSFCIKWTDKGLNKVADFNLGSSFDGLAPDAQKMSVVSRWRSFLKPNRLRELVSWRTSEEEYLSLFSGSQESASDNEVVELTEKIFLSRTE